MALIPLVCGFVVLRHRAIFGFALVRLPGIEFGGGGGEGFLADLDLPDRQTSAVWKPVLRCTKVPCGEAGRVIREDCHGYRYLAIVLSSAA